MSGSDTVTLIILNEEINGIMKIVKSREESGSLIKNVRETIKEQKDRLLMLLRTLDFTLLENLLIGKGQLELVKEQLEQARMFNAASFY